MSYNFDDTEVLNNIAVPFDYGELEITPNTNYVDAAKCFITKLDEIIYLLLKKEQDGRAHVKTAVWALALALGSKHLEGKSMTEIAEYLDVTRAAVSKQTVQFSKMLNLPASPYMAPTRKSYGKETELKKAARLAAGVDERSSGLNVAELTLSLINHNIERFIDYGDEPAECWGKVIRTCGKGDITAYFIKNQYIERLFNGSESIEDIVSAWVSSGTLQDRSSRLGKQKSRSIVKTIGGTSHRGYCISIKEVTRGVLNYGEV